QERLVGDALMKFPRTAGDDDYVNIFPARGRCLSCSSASRVSNLGAQRSRECSRGGPRRIVMMKRAWVLISLLLLAPISACGGAPDTAPVAEHEGAVQLALTTDAGGTTYRLSPATFTVTGARTLVLDGSSVDILEQKLPVGNYAIQLNDGWAMQ